MYLVERLLTLLGSLLLPLATFQYRLKHMNDPSPIRSYLTPVEEGIICDLINHYFSRGFPMNKEDMADAVQILVESLPAERQQKLPFINHRPGKKFLRNFLSRHQEKISFRRCAKEEEARWKACNAETLTTHMLSLGKIIDENQIDSARIANLDETGLSPNKDCLHSDRRKAYVTRSTRPQQRAPEFKNIDRFTLMPVIFASGKTGRPLVVMKGKQLKYQVRKMGNEEAVETLHDCLPEGSLRVMREKEAGVDSSNFYQWAECFVNDCQPLTSNGRKVLLIMDGYRSHKSYRTMHLFDQNGIIVYALPSHTSGMTQPLDVGVFGPFKEHLRNLVEVLSDPMQSNIYSVFDYIKLVRTAYGKAFTRSNIASGLIKTGISPCNWRNLITVPGPLSVRENNRLATVEEIAEMISKKREMLRKHIGLQPVVIRGGYLDTTDGLCLTSTDALEMARQKDVSDQAKKAEAARRDAERAAQEAKERERIRKARLAFEKLALSRRVRLYSAPNILPRPFKVRRQIMKHRLAERRAETHRQALVASTNNATN